MDPLSDGLLNDSQFSYFPRSSKKSFPETIQLQVNFLILNNSVNLNMSLYQLEGFVRTSSLYSQVLMKNNANSEINKLKSENLVKAT